MVGVTSGCVRMMLFYTRRLIDVILLVARAPSFVRASSYLAVLLFFHVLVFAAAVFPLCVCWLSTFSARGVPSSALSARAPC